MKPCHAKKIAAALVLAGGLLSINRAQAQATLISDFHNFNLSATYANWNADGADPLNGGSGFAPIITSGATGYEVQAQGYGSGAYNFATPISAPGATSFLFTFTINQAMVHGDGSGLWFGPNVDIADGTHLVHLTANNAGANYLSYGPYVGPGTYTLTGSLNDQNGGAPLDVNTITAFNLEVDPAEFGGGAPYDITYKSLQLITPVPEPSTISLIGLAIAGAAFTARRGKKV